MKKVSKNNPSRLYKMRADAQVQDEAMERINQIARENNLEVIIISNEDFESMVDWRHGEDEESSKRLPYTVQECEDFKDGLRESLWSNWSDCCSDVFEQVVQPEPESK